MKRLSTALVETAAAAVVLAALSAGPAAAQIGNPAGMAPTSIDDPPGKPAPSRTNVQDELFVRLVGAAQLAEVQGADVEQFFA